MTIVVGYVPGPQGEAALTRAGEEASLRDVPVVVVNSSRGDSGIDARQPQTSVLQRMVAELRTDGVDCEIRSVVRDRDAAEAILGVADEVSASLIVIGLKRRSPVGKLLLGSTSQRVLLDAVCPVLAVRA